MIIRLSSVLKTLGVALLITGLTLLFAYFVRNERRVNDLEFRVNTIQKPVLVERKSEVVKVATATPVPTPKPTPKLKIK